MKHALFSKNEYIIRFVGPRSDIVVVPSSFCLPRVQLPLFPYISTNSQILLTAMYQSKQWILLFQE